MHLDLRKFRQEYGGDLTLAQQEHIEGIIERFAEMAYAKYARGAREHGGNLWENQNILKEAREEAVDLFTYLCS